MASNSYTHKYSCKNTRLCPNTQFLNTQQRGYQTFEPLHEKTNILHMRNKDADQLRGNREADQRLCFRYTDSTISLLPKCEISSLQPSSVVMQPGLCGTWSETPKTGFLRTRLICELLPGLVPFASLWHDWWILDKNVYMKKNYGRAQTFRSFSSNAQ